MFCTATTKGIEMPTIKMQSRKIARNTNFRREVSYTSLRVFSLATAPSSTAAPNIATAVEYALHRVMSCVGVVDWYRLSTMEPCEFDIPSWLPCGSRFVTSLSLSPVTDSVLCDFVSSIAPDFTALKKRAPYRPFAIALLFRAVIAEEKGNLPYKVAGGKELPADTPAAFNPSELLSGSVCCVPSETDRIINRKALDNEGSFDPSIFDDLYPNGTNAEDSEWF